MKEINVKVLGTVAPYCFQDKNCPGFLIEYNGFKYLLDCGNGITRYMNLKDDLDNLKILISHLHPDHYGDLISIIQTAKVYKRLGYLDKDIDIYIPSSDTVEVFEDERDKDGWATKRTVKKHIIDYDIIHNYETNNPVSIIDYDEINIKDNDLEIISQRVSHDLFTYAFRINTPSGSIAYSGDTGTENNLRTFVKDVNLFICEATYLKGQYRNQNTHLYAHEAAEIAKDADVEKLLLTHFWPEIDKGEYVKEAKQVFKNVEAAEENKVYTLKR